MRPHAILLSVPSRSILLLAPLVGGATLLLIRAALACPSTADQTAQVELDMGGGATAEITVSVWDHEKLGIPEEERPEDSCFAWVEANLSDFPSIESRYGTGRIADEIASVVAEWEIQSCGVSVWYENDVGADFAEHELCRSGRYGFEGGRAHSISSEAYCWEPPTPEDIAEMEAHRVQVLEELDEENG